MHLQTLSGVEGAVSHFERPPERRSVGRGVEKWTFSKIALIISRLRSIFFSHPSTPLGSLFQLSNLDASVTHLVPMILQQYLSFLCFAEIGPHFELADGHELSIFC